MGLSVSEARAGVIAVPPPGPNRVANADAVIVGKVEGIEPQDVKAGNVAYRVAVVRIDETLRGGNSGKTLRVGFVPLPTPKGGDKGPFVVSSGARDVQLQAGQEGLFVLTKKAKEGFHVLGGPVGYFVASAKNPDFDKEVRLAKVAARIMDNPQAALKSKDAEERLLAAAMLIGDYRTFRGQPKQEAIDAAESKLIMQVLADSDWQARMDFSSLRPSPSQLFQQLGVTAKDGFMPPAGGNYQAAAEAWVRANAATYRIQRLIPGEKK
jgi:hypothetical protein